MCLDGDPLAKTARTIKYKLYEEFYKHGLITFDVALKVVGSSLSGKYVTNPKSFKALAEKISLEYFEFKRKDETNLNIKEFIDEERIKRLIEETVMYNF